VSDVGDRFRHPPAQAPARPRIAPARYQRNHLRRHRPADGRGGGHHPCGVGWPVGVLDFGKIRRLFSTVQKLAFGERDGGCAFGGCTAPPPSYEGSSHHLVVRRRKHRPRQRDKLQIRPCYASFNRDVSQARDSVVNSSRGTIVGLRPRRGISATTALDARRDL
jgi:hypothetical protein